MKNHFLSKYNLLDIIQNIIYFILLLLVFIISFSPFFGLAYFIMSKDGIYGFQISLANKFWLFQVVTSVAVASSLFSVLNYFGQKLLSLFPQHSTLALKDEKSVLIFAQKFSLGIFIISGVLNSLSVLLNVRILYLIGIIILIGVLYSIYVIISTSRRNK